MKTYWTTVTKNEKSKFIYTEITGQEANAIGLRNGKAYYKKDAIVHLTPDAKADVYLEKRKEQPTLVKYFSTQREIDELMGKLGYCI